MKIFLFHIVFFIALVLCWLTITGRAAEWNYRDWGNSRFGPLFLGGFFSDLSSYKRFSFWIGWIILAAVLFVYVTSMYQWIRG